MRSWDNALAVPSNQVNPSFTVGAHIDIFYREVEDDCISFRRYCARRFTHCSYSYALVVMSFIAPASFPLAAQHGRVALVYGRDDLLIIAADGLVKNSRYAFCKVRQEGNLAFTAVGVYGTPPDDIFSLAHKAFKPEVQRILCSIRFKE